MSLHSTRATLLTGRGREGKGEEKGKGKEKGKRKEKGKEKEKRLNSGKERDIINVARALGTGILLVLFARPQFFAKKSPSYRNFLRYITTLHNPIAQVLNCNSVGKTI